ncbi:toprim domain-containing protein [Nitrosomonas supralitoralis]|uniref:Toprim domain-containing protein n=1 Tax=Nitrosomonas supralitoralis TaxID=2116706 RepID=A0A2P7NYF2_9PROT|nr:toprim domain-containing protein [Nitrosomonas supralitoralis]PSJ18449.1 hypothetical protein C7H79_02360 [Nitrosomonas supralitoralis]
MKNALLTKGAGVNKYKINFNTFAQNYTSIEEQFRQAMQAAGIHYSGKIIADGKLHRFSTNINRKDETGWYVLHNDNLPAGIFGDWRAGLRQNWKMLGQGYRQVPQELIKQIKEAEQQRGAEILQKQAKAAKKARYIWSESNSLIEHAYLKRKSIQAHGARLYLNELVAIPIYNESDQLVNLQFINPQGEKRFLSGARKRGCFHILGDLTDRILICEGFATGASLYEDCGQRVVIAFDAGNLLPVARNIKELSPDSEVIICGDNDLSGVGQTKAREAALSIGGKVLIPPVPGQDWNDYLTGGNHA